MLDFKVKFLDFSFLEKRNYQKLSEVSRFCTKPHTGFRENDTVKDDGVSTALEFIKTCNYFYFNSFISLFETVWFIWSSPLGPSVLNLYSQYHLIYLSYHPSICLSLCRSSRWEMFLKTDVLKVLQYSQENTCVGVCFNNVQTCKCFPTLVFFCKYCKIF